MSAATVNTAHVDEHHSDSSVMTFGFWMYILSDLILFATLFASIAIFGSAYSAGPAPTDIIDGEPLFNLRFVLIETFLLLFSSITYGMAMVQVGKNNVGGVRAWMVITFLLGLVFICMEVYEFNHLAHNVYYFEPAAGRMIMSAYWSSFFLLVGTHGLHVTVGLIWMALMFAHLGRHGLDADNKTRLSCLSIFWHFLDIVWVGVFTAVYLIASLPSGAV